MYPLRRLTFAIAVLSAAIFIPARAADAPAPASTPAAAAAEIQRLKDLLEQQRQQIDALRRAVDQQKSQLEGLAAPAAPRATAPDRLVASGSPMIVPPPSTTTPALDPPAAVPAVHPPASAAPLQLQLGNITIMPVGFMDATMVWRDKNAGSGIGSNFGSVPFNTAVPAAKLSEFRFSPQNSRIGFRIDGNWKGARFIAYNEFDFLGAGAANTIGVTNGAFVPRIRLYWLDVRKGSLEFLAGQSWSMLTPNRVGISALPGDLFYGQVVDVNYIAGLTWTRQPGVRVLYHAGPRATFGFSLENPNQYGGGSGGAGQIVMPAALASVLGTQIDNGSASYLQTPNARPDMIAKAAFDPSPRGHIEVGGVLRSFQVYNQPFNATSAANGGGVSLNGNYEVRKGLRLISNNYWSDGGGRYMFGNAPDVIVRANGVISPVHAGGVNAGFEYTASPKVQFWGYYGAIYVGRDVAIDGNGKPVGWGFTGSPNSQDRAIQEATLGATQTVWKDPRYGAVSLMYQYEFLTRNPWYVAAGTLKSAHDNTVYFNVRYTLPGSAPAPGK